MFGYIKAYKPELKMSEFETYKAVYCSLCRQLGKSYGPFARLILSYDFNFLAMLKLGLQDDCPGFKKARCSFNPFVRCHKLKNKSTDMEFTASAAVIIFYHKLRDNIRDSKFFKRLIYYMIYPLFALARNKAKKKYIDIDETINKFINKQIDIENSENPGIDAASHPTSQILSYLFSYGVEEPSEKRILERLGYCMGKWIYLTDALDDFQKDMKTGNFNPIILSGKIAENDEPGDSDILLENAKSETIAALNVCVTESASAFELLEFKRYKGILGNIIYLGMPHITKNLNPERKTNK